MLKVIGNQLTQLAKLSTQIFYFASQQGILLDQIFNLTSQPRNCHEKLYGQNHQENQSPDEQGCYGKNRGYDLNDGLG